MKPKPFRETETRNGTLSTLFLVLLVTCFLLIAMFVCFHPNYSGGWRPESRSPELTLEAAYPLGALPLQPVIGDIDADGRTEIVVSAGEKLYVLRKHNTTIEKVWCRTFHESVVHSPAIGDLNADGKAEIVVFVSTNSQGSLYALEPDGSVFWTAGGLPAGVYGATRPTLAKLNFGGYGYSDVALVLPDGKIGVFDGETGERIWEKNFSYLFSSLSSRLCYDGTVAILDLDEDGRNELIATIFPLGEKGYVTVCGQDGREWFSVPGQNFALADIQLDSSPELIVTATRKLDVYNIAGKLQWSYPTTIDGSGGAVVTDLNGDYKPEIVVNTGTAIAALQYDGTLLWSRTKGEAFLDSEFSAGDLNGDGNDEIVVLSTRYVINVLDGRTGAIIASGEPGVTDDKGYASALPLLADVDSDMHAEVVLCVPDIEHGGLLLVYGQAYWQKLRPTWNQAVYYSLNIDDDLKVTNYNLPWREVRECNRWRSQQRIFYTGNCGFLGLEFSVSPTVLFSADTATVNVHAKHCFESVVPNFPISLTVSAGSLAQTSGNTNSAGDFSTTYKAPLVSTRTRVTLGVSGYGNINEAGGTMVHSGSAQIDLFIKPWPMFLTITPNPSLVYSEGRSNVRVHVHNGSIPVANAHIILTVSNGGTLTPSSGFSDTNGNLDLSFSAPLVTGTQNIVCRINGTAKKLGYSDAVGDAEITVVPKPTVPVPPVPPPPPPPPPMPPPPNVPVPVMEPLPLELPLSTPLMQPLFQPMTVGLVQPTLALSMVGQTITTGVTVVAPLASLLALGIVERVKLKRKMRALGVLAMKEERKLKMGED